jgi:hypothetical protein
MRIEVNPVKLGSAHTVFKQVMSDRSQGMPFSGFQHEFFVDHEVKYRWRSYYEAEQVLCMVEWKYWIKTFGRIINVVKEVCEPTIRGNLLEHRWGLKRSAEGALYKVNTPEEISHLERQLFLFFREASEQSAEFGPRFDAAAQYLRDRHLGCIGHFWHTLPFC